MRWIKSLSTREYLSPSVARNRWKARHVSAPYPERVRSLSRNPITWPKGVYGKSAAYSGSASSRGVKNASVKAFSRTNSWLRFPKSMSTRSCLSWTPPRSRQRIIQFSSSIYGTARVLNFGRWLPKFIPSKPTCRWRIWVSTTSPGLQPIRVSTVGSRRVLHLSNLTEPPRRFMQSSACGLPLAACLWRQEMLR